jgi:Ca-activated chloride channel family protein
MSFKDPLFILLIPMVLGLLYYARRRGKPAGIRFSNGELLKGLPESMRMRLSGKLFFLRAFVSVLIILALAQPQFILKESKIETEGIDIVLTIDVSSSMLAEDFTIASKRINRIDAAKEVIKDFIHRRKSDRIGMVSFAAKAYTVCPLTLDYDWLLTNLQRVNVGMIEDNTAIGSGLASALNRLKGSAAKGKAVILLTDGRNNAGKITPREAAAAAQALKIKIYTIGMGSKGQVPYPAKDPFGNKIYRMIQLDMDEDLLTWIASETEAKYFRAPSVTSLREIFQEIDKLEKVPIEEKVYEERQECFPLFLIPGMVLLSLEMTLSRTLLRRIP